MLGSMLVKTLALNRELQVKVVERRELDVEKASSKDILEAIKGADWIINAIGITKPYIHDDNAAEIKRAVYINSFFPHLLADAIRGKAKIIQIATDCVFSGQKGKYVETDVHDCTDVYGKTKSLGEVFAKNVYHLRCSLVGPEPIKHIFLMDWLLRQPKGAKIEGFTNHRWNGITTLHFAKICRGIIRKRAKLPHIQHVIPRNVVSKSELLKITAREFKREDIIIKDVKASEAIDRTLSTNNKSLNSKLWRFAGYKSVPTIQAMIKELAT